MHNIRIYYKNINNMDNINDLVYLQCVKVHSKLRVRIISRGYNPYANCQFPRNIRSENATYTVKSSDITFKYKGDCLFYHIAKHNITIINNNIINNNITIPSDLEIFKTPECVICLEQESYIIFMPCGHFCICDNCNNILKDRKFPLCRSIIIKYVNHNDL